MSNIEFTSEITVELLDYCGSDRNISRAAWVSNLAQRVADDATEEKIQGLITSLMRQKHGSPFESGYLEFFIDAPRAVRDEHVRHRIGSYSSSSLRYNQGEVRLYIPPAHRPLKQAEGFKKMRPVYEPLHPEAYKMYVRTLREGYKATYKSYDELHELGFCETEATRWLTHDGKMTPYIARFNPRSLMAFLSLRTHNDEANHVSYPMWEIEQVARQIESDFATLFPFTYEAFNTLGREAP